MSKVYLIGAGPGAPDLITVKGRNILKAADVIIYDYLVDRRILENAKPDAELICCDKLGKKSYSNGFSIHQNRINSLIVKRAKSGKNVARLKNGDPSVFGRLSQELDALVKNRIEFEIVPGVTAANAAAALSGIPLTDRRFTSSVVFVTGHEDINKNESAINWEKIAGCGTIVLYMAVENLDKIAREIINSGKDENTPVAIAQNISLPNQKFLTGTLKDIAKKVKRKKINPPAVVIIGETARLEKRFNWLNESKRILFTGLSKERYFIKGTHFHLPLIKIKPMEDYRKFDKCLKDTKNFDWIVFASRYGVEYFFKRLNAIGKDARILSNIKIAAIGNSTKSRLLEFGIVADLVGKIESSKGIIDEFSAKGGSASGGKKIDLKGKRIFLPRSDISDKGLKEALEKLGATTVTAFAYRNVAEEDLPDLDLEFFDEIMFTSPSTVRSFKKRYKKIPKTVKARYIGDVTEKEARKCRLLG